MISDYLRELKSKTGYTCEDIEKVSGIPLSTVVRVFSSKTLHPRIDTLEPIVTAMGGSMDELFKKDIKEEEDMYTEDKASKLYGRCIEELKKSHEKETALLKEQIKSLEADKDWLKFVAGFSYVGLIIFLVMVLIISNAR